MIEVVMLGAGVSGVGGLLAPALISRIPEPGLDVESEEPAKIAYADIGSSRSLGLKCAVVSAVVGGILGGFLGWDVSLIFLLPLVPVLVALSVVDWRTRLLPTWLIARTYVGLVIAVLVASLVAGENADLVRAGWGWLIAGVTFFLLWFIHPRGLGYGDVRLSGVLGIALGYLGWGQLLTGLYAGFLLGGVIGAVLAVIGVADRKGVPFGPFMVMGALLGILIGPWAASHLVGGGG